MYSFYMDLMCLRNFIANIYAHCYLPSVIELAPCKYKRVYFYFDVQKKLIFIYLFFFGADLTFILRPIQLGADLTGNQMD